MGVKASKLSRSYSIGTSGRFKRLGVPPLTPKGYVPVSVGVNDIDARRFIVHTKTLRDEDFLKMLSKSAEEYGFCNEGVLRIPYEAKAFEEWITIRRNKPKIIPVN